MQKRKVTLIHPESPLERSSQSESQFGPVDVDPQEGLSRLLRDLRTRPEGLSDREADRRLVVYGPNELRRRAGTGWPRRVSAQLVHPLALLLWLAAALAAAAGTLPLAIAIVVVVTLNAAFALLQEHQAERAVEALTEYLPPQSVVVRDGVRRRIPARELVPGDVIVISEGDRVSADARILSGTVEMDLSLLNGESVPVVRTSETGSHRGPLIDAKDLLFSGTTCLHGEAAAAVHATGMRTELGRIAALSQRVNVEDSPLERQVKHVARLIAIVAIGMGIAFIPMGMLIAGLSFADTLQFAIGLLVANVPEGLLPTITLALAVGVRVLARRGALVKRISAVETLGSTSVICTDKTGTLTQNRMTVRRCWTPEGAVNIGDSGPSEPSALVTHLLEVAVACSNTRDGSDTTGDPTEVALSRAAAAHGVDGSQLPERLAVFHFDPALRRMSTVDHGSDGLLSVHSKGAPEEIIGRCATTAGPRGVEVLTPEDVAGMDHLLEAWAADGMRILAIAEKPLPAVDLHTLTRDAAESQLTLLGLVALEDPPRPEVFAAVQSCHAAGIRLIVVTGDYGLTAQGIARRVGIGTSQTPVISGAELDTMTEDELDATLSHNQELIFARSSPEAKLRIADALRSEGYVVAMTGDGANDAPALRRADIGVAMGRSGTDVAREAATMVLTDDNFATIVTAIEAGRQVYDNVRKFIVYIFAHATPEVVPFLLYALSGGNIPLPLTVMQILAIDLGTETLPALALGREKAEPGLMNRPPRRRGQDVIDGPMLARAWGLLGGVSAILVLALFLVTLVTGGWQWGDDVSSGPLHTTWQQATTMTFLAIVACQIGTAMAARTQTASLRSVGLMSNPLLLLGIAFEVVFAAAIVAIPGLRQIFGTAVPDARLMIALAPLPVVVWGVDEIVRWLRRRRALRAAAGRDL